MREILAVDERIGTGDCTRDAITGMREFPMDPRSPKWRAPLRAGERATAGFQRWWSAKLQPMRSGWVLVGLVISAGCALVPDLGGLTGGQPTLADAGRDAAPDATTDAGIDVDASTLIVPLKATADVIRINAQGVDFPSFEVNAGLGQGGEVRRTGIRFTNVQIPRNATILSATLTLYAAEAHGGAMTSTALALEQSDDPKAWVGTIGDFDQRPQTATIPWLNLPPWKIGDKIVTPDLASLLQAIVNRPGWATGHAVVVFWQNNGSVGNDQQRVAHTFEGGAPTDPLLTVRFF